MRILILEDDVNMRRALERSLGRDGHELLAADSVAACRPLFDVGVIDLHLPDGSGRVVAAELLAARVLGRALFFTASTNRVELAEAARVGTVLPKDLAGLRRVLERIGERGEGGR